MIFGIERQLQFNWNCLFFISLVLPFDRYI